MDCTFFRFSYTETEWNKIKISLEKSGYKNPSAYLRKKTNELYCSPPELCIKKRFKISSDNETFDKIERLSEVLNEHPNSLIKKYILDPLLHSI